MAGKKTLFLLVCGLMLHVSAAFYEYCNLENEPEQDIAINPENGDYIILDEDTTNNRNLLMNDLMELPFFLSSLSLPQKQEAAILPRTLADVSSSSNTATWTRFTARRCTCAPPTENYFCSVPITHCVVPKPGLSRDGELPHCVFMNRKRQVAKTVWLLSIGCYLVMAICLFGTKSGRSILDYLMSICFPWWNAWVVDRIVENDPARVSALLARYSRRRLRQMEQAYTEYVTTRTLEQGIDDSQDDANPKALVLKTRTYHQEEESEEMLCTICLTAVEEGDRVGVLDCGHTFHVGCLKSWLSRRNACPLCSKQAAKPHVDEESQTHASTTFDSMSSMPLDDIPQY